MNSLISEAFCHSSKQPSCVDYGRNLFISQIEHTLILFPCCKSIEDKTSSPNFPVDDAKFTYNQVFSFEYMQKNSFPCMSSQPAIHTSVLSKMKKKTTKGPNWFSFWSVRQPASVQAYIKMRHKAAWPVPFLIPPIGFFGFVPVPQGKGLQFEERGEKVQFTYEAERQSSCCCRWLVGRSLE